MPRYIRREPLRDEAVARSLVQFGSLWVSGLGVLLAGSYLLEMGPSYALRITLYALASGVGLLAWLVGRMLSWRLAAYCLIWGVWLVIVLVAWEAGGIHSNNHLGFLAMLVFAGWALGKTPTCTLLAASIAVIAGFKLALNMGWMPAGRVMASWSYTLYFTGMAMLTAWATLMTRGIFERRAIEAEAANAQLQESQLELRKLTLAVEQSPASIVITDINERVVYANAAFLKSAGYTLDEVLGRPSKEVSTAGLTGKQREEARKALDSGKVWHGDLHNVRKDGSAVVEDVRVAPLHDGSSQPAYFVELKQDITESLQAQATIYQLSNFDNVTGLPNRYAFLKRLTELKDANQLRPRKGEQELCHGLLLVDIDRFTNFNDVHGAMVGDQLLCAVSARLSGVLPPTGLLVRHSADEFAVVIEGLSGHPEDAELLTKAYAERLVQAMESDTVRVTGMPDAVRVTFSVGMTVFPVSQEDSEIEALRRAQTAMHEAKSLGGAQALMFQEVMAENADRRYRIEKGLRRAIGDGQLRLFLQGQFNASDVAAGVEALVRWEHPERGMVSPADFIPIAEESDLIVLLGDWMLEQVCHLLVLPEVKAQRLQMSVNVSARQFLHSDFVSKLEELLAYTGADPQLLTLEVTESLVLSDFDEAGRKMHYLRKLGVQFALDDFGTGYSSMAYLKRLPIQEIKIDQSFVRDVDISPHSAALIEAILWVAGRFGLRVVAEGVEKREQVHMLRQWSPAILCQGYVHERPMPYRAWMEKRFVGLQLPHEGI